MTSSSSQFRFATARILRALVLPLLLVGTGTACAQDAADYVTIVPIGPAFALNDINHVSFRQNSLTSVQVGSDTYQFAAYYRTVSGSSTRRVTVARRLHGSSDWDIFNYTTGFNDPNSNANDSHNTISIGVDGDGIMHMSWGMHNNNLIYRRSTASVLNSNPIVFGGNLAMTATNENSVTYPQFYNLPDGDLLFFYRNGASGDGNNYLNRYDTATDAWSAVQHPLFDGLTSSVNAYFNTLASDSQGELHATWTDRSTPAFQTNHNIYYARSPDAGVTWTKMDGTPYSLPITEPTAELVVPIPQNSTLINQTSMTLDKNDNPLVATWWAPDTAQGNFTRQYMLAYYDGNAWQTSQISNRPNEPLQTDATVRDLARPIVMVDDDNRTIVVMRYDQRSDVVTIGYSEDRQNWNLVDLTATGLGDWEPTYDAELWKRENKLHLLYQPVGLGSASSTISVLEWDAKAFFFDLGPPPLALQIDRSTGLATIANLTEADISITGYSISSAGGQLGPNRWISLADQAVVGWTESQSTAYGLAESTAGPPLTLAADSGASAIGTPYVGKPISFRVDAPADLEFEYTVDGETRAGKIQYSDFSLNNLSLLVDPDTGLARLENTSPFSVAIDGYTISSASQSLEPARWESLQDQAAAGEWSEANPTSDRLSELQSTGETPLAPGDSFEMGQLFDAASGEQDLVFDFLLAGDSASLRGVVLYTDVRLTGDYNDDGLVDAADYPVWRDLLGKAVGLGSGADGDRDGEITTADYEVWRANFGRSLASFAAAAVATVPEPTAVWLLFCGILALPLFSSRGRWPRSQGQTAETVQTASGLPH